MNGINPINTSWGALLPEVAQQAAQQRLMGQQGALLGQQSALVGQQAQQAAVATKLAQARLPLVLSALHSFEAPSPGAGVTPGGMPIAGASSGSGFGGLPFAPTGGAPGQGAPAQSDTSGAAGTGAGAASPLDNFFAPGGAATVDKMLRQQFFVNPAGTPQEVRDLITAGLSGDPGLLAAAKYQRDFGVQQRLAQSRYESSNLYDALASVADAPAGTALQTLAAVNPTLAKQIERTAKSPEQAGQMARTFAAEVGAQVHQYTGRKVSMNKAGEYRDALTGLPVPGVERMGLSSQQWAGIAQRGLEPVSVPQSNGTTITVPRWQAPGSGANSLEQWMINTTRRAGVLAVQPTISGAPQVTAALRIRSGIQQAAQQAAQRNGGIAPPLSNVNPQLAKALADPAFRLQQPAPVFGVSATPEVLAQQKITAQARANLMQQSQLATQTAAQALTYLKAAQEIMTNKGRMPRVGWGGAAYNQVTRIFGGVNSTNYQQVVKYLNNAALQLARQQYGANMSTAEVHLQLNDMSPHASQTPAAINALLAENIRNAQYAINSAARVRPYLHAGNDPQSFAEWNQKFFPQQEIVNQLGKAVAGAGATGATATSVPAVGAFVDGYRFLGGNPASPASWAPAGKAR